MNTKKLPPIILSVGGSIIVPKSGFDPAFLQNFKELIIEKTKQGQTCILVIGGGATARRYQKVLREVSSEISNEDLDWMGIHSTVLNAQLVRYLFGEYADKRIVTDPRKKIKTNKKIIIAAGWRPGCSTDYGAVLLAQAYGVQSLFNLSNTSFVYDKDPAKYSEAKKIEQIDWKTFRRDIVGDVWTPGKHVPFDPIASKKAQALKLTVSFVEGNNLSEVKAAINGEKFTGTIITP